MVTDPWDSTASPNGWHDSNGTETRGNNLWAASVPSAGEQIFARSDNLTFEFGYDPSAADPQDNRDAAVTQAFYVANMAHDLFYLLGFDEAAGNMQDDNGGGEGQGGDAVEVQVHHYDGTNNAFFQRTVDGEAPYLKLYLFDMTDPIRDGAFDNGIVIHEMTHGCE